METEYGFFIYREPVSGMNRPLRQIITAGTEEVDRLKELTDYKNTPGRSRVFFFWSQGVISGPFPGQLA